MRIYLSFLQSPLNHAIPPYHHWSAYMRGGIGEAGHELVESPEVDWAECLTYRTEADWHAWRQRTWPRVLDTVQRTHREQGLDLFLCYLFPQMVDVEAIRSIKALGIPCVNFFCDNVREFKTVPSCYAIFDLHWVPEYDGCSLYEKQGLPYLFAPMPMWVAPAQRTWDHAERYGTVFIGSSDIQRIALFARYLALGGQLELRGAGWTEESSAPATRPGKTRASGSNLLLNQIDFIRREGWIPFARKIGQRFQPKISLDIFKPCLAPRPDNAEYIRIVQQSRIFLGVNRFPGYLHPFARPGVYSRLRDLEVPMMGACYLTEMAPGLDQLYEVGQEIEVFTNAENLLEKVTMLNADATRRQNLRRKGQQRVLAEHTIPVTLGRIMQHLYGRAG
ncbi:MAG: glycosyltransferase [Magnetococcus sp. DMHC-1]